jgi:K+-transporting ATPase A subunit
MTLAGWAQLVALIVALGITAPLLGRYMANVYEGVPSRLDRVFGPVERLFYARVASTPTVSSAGTCTRSRYSRSAWSGCCCCT